MADSTTIDFGEIPTECIDFSVLQDENIEKQFRKLYCDDPENPNCKKCYPIFSIVLYCMAHTLRPNKENILDFSLNQMKWLIGEAWRSYLTSFQNCAANKMDGHATLEEALKCPKCIKIHLKCLPEVLKMMYMSQDFKAPLEFCLTGAHFHYHIMKMLYECKMGCLPRQRTLEDLL